MQINSNQNFVRKLAIKSRAARKRAPLIFFSFALGIFESGCSAHMWREGWAIHSTTLFDRKMVGYHRPVAFKNANGDVLFKYDVHVTRYGALGQLTFEEQNLGLQRLTNVTSRMALQPINNNTRLVKNAVVFWAKKRNFPGAVGTNVFVQPNHNLPILKVKLESESSWTFPTNECVVWAKEYIWYVPPLHTNDVPMAAVLSKETIHTPAYLYPAKVVLFPIFLVGDVLTAPIMFFDR